MKKLLWFVLAVLIVTCSMRLYAFSGSDKAVENRSLKGFERIRLQGSPDIKYTQGKAHLVGQGEGTKECPEECADPYGGKLPYCQCQVGWLL